MYVTKWNACTGQKKCLLCLEGKLHPELDSVGFTDLDYDNTTGPINLLKFVMHLYIEIMFSYIFFYPLVDDRRDCLCILWGSDCITFVFLIITDSNLCACFVIYLINDIFKQKWRSVLHAFTSRINELQLLTRFDTRPFLPSNSSIFELLPCGCKGQPNNLPAPLSVKVNQLVNRHFS